MGKSWKNFEERFGSLIYHAVNVNQEARLVPHLYAFKRILSTKVYGAVITQTTENPSLSTRGNLRNVCRNDKRECILGDEKSASNFDGRRADTNEKKRG